jgi:hypothetical protein
MASTTTSARVMVLARTRPATQGCGRSDPVSV